MRSRDEFRGVSHMWCHYRERKKREKAPKREARERSRKKSLKAFLLLCRERKQTKPFAFERERWRW